MRVLTDIEFKLVERLSADFRAAGKRYGEACDEAGVDYEVARSYAITVVLDLFLHLAEDAAMSPTKMLQTYSELRKLVFRRLDS